MKKRKKENGIDRFIEWQEHQYDPGYWTGGRIPPFLLGKRPNKMGYTILVLGFLYLIISIVTGEVIMCLLAPVVIAVGVVLLRPDKKKSGKKSSSKPKK